jgi:N6-adenosine-specific RNA methylase IME4
MSSCRYCHESIKGRSDKKFCSDYCRATFHNQRNQKEYYYIRLINRALKKNRDILYNFYTNGILEVSLEDLGIWGFNIEFITNIKIDENGVPVKCCYDMAYSDSDNCTIQIIQLKENVESKIRFLPC